MPILIRRQSCAVISVGATIDAAQERFDWHDGFFHDAETHPGGAVTPPESISPRIETGARDGREKGAERQGGHNEPHRNRHASA